MFFQRPAIEYFYSNFESDTILIVTCHGCMQTDNDSEKNVYFKGKKIVDDMFYYI